MSYLELYLGWRPCHDTQHPHAEAGQGTVLHPPDGNPTLLAPRIPCDAEQAQARGIGGRAQMKRLRLVAVA